MNLKEKNKLKDCPEININIKTVKMKKTKETSFFVEQFIKAKDGKNTTQVAENALIKAKSRIEAAIMTLKGNSVDFEERLNEAKENVLNARVNFGEAIDSGEDYINNLIRSRQNFIDAQEEYDTHLDKIKFLQEELDLIN